MNKDNSLEKIDIVKLLLWVILILIIVFSLSAGLIIPNINRLKSASSVLASSKSALKTDEKNLEKYQKLLSDFKDTHADELKRLDTEFDKDEFVRFCDSFFTVTSIEEISGDLDYEEKIDDLNEDMQDDTHLAAQNKLENLKNEDLMRQNLNEESQANESDNQNPSEEKKEKNRFLRYQLKAQSKLKSPTTFYEFIDALNEYKNVIKVSFPITLKGTQNGIELSFTILVFGERHDAK